MLASRSSTTSTRPCRCGDGMCPLPRPLSARDAVRFINITPPAADSPYAKGARGARLFTESHDGSVGTERMDRKPGTHVLVVDDQSGFRELLKRFLEPAGYEVRTASDAHEALARLADAPPAVAILDVHMPGPNGLWLANQIRSGSPTTAIVLATSDDTVPPVESLKKGVVAYIVKPLQRGAVL